jgi:hypothetical protein
MFAPVLTSNYHLNFKSRITIRTLKYLVCIQWCSESISSSRYNFERNDQEKVVSRLTSYDASSAARNALGVITGNFIPL